MAAEEYKTSAGRLREAGVRRIHELRDAYDEHGDPKQPAEEWTLQRIAMAMDLSIGTIHNICSGKTHRDLHPALSKGKPVKITEL